MAKINPGNKTTIRIKGMSTLLRNLQHLGDQVGGKIGKKAMTKALTPMLKDARQGIPVETGFSKKSLAKKVLFYKTSNVVLGLIGADKAYRTFRKTNSKGKKMYHAPARILHLLEFGTERAPGSRFLSNAYNNNIQQTMVTFAKEVHKEINKLRFKFTR